MIKIVREMERWWGGFKSGSLARGLYIPESKQEEIRRKFADDTEQKKQSLCYWIKTDPLASWRRLITQLDSMKLSKLAKSIRLNAEPLTGSHQLYITGILCIENMPCGMQMVLMTVLYSGTSHNGPSEKRTPTLQRTLAVFRIETTIAVIH